MPIRRRASSRWKRGARRSNSFKKSWKKSSTEPMVGLGRSDGENRSFALDRPTSLVWLCNDLRLADNPALSAACNSDMRVVALYIHETDEDVRAPGGAARWWLH